MKENISQILRILKSVINWKKKVSILMILIFKNKNVIIYFFKN